MHERSHIIDIYMMIYLTKLCFRIFFVIVKKIVIKLKFWKNQNFLKSKPRNVQLIQILFKCLYITEKWYWSSGHYN